jgi:diguanylate cyclase (GGDEF)-like protein
MTSAPHLSPATLARAWSALLQQTADAALLVDGDGAVVAASARAEDLLGPVAAGADARALLGLAAGAPLDGSVAAGGQQATLACTSLAGEDGAPDAALLILTPAAAPAAAPSQRERRLREVTLAISSARGIDEILDRVVRLSIELIGADAGALPLYDPERDCLLPAYPVNLDFMLSVHHRGSGRIWDVVDTGRSQLINRYAEDTQAVPALLERGVQAVLGVPVTAGAQLLGVLVLYHRTPGKSFSARDQELLEIVGRQAGVALQKARLYQAAIREADRRALLYQASVAFGSALASDELYAAIHRTAARLMRCDTCIIALLDEPRQELDYVYMAERGRLWPPERVPLWRGLLGYVMQTGVSLRLTNCDDEVDALFGAEDVGDSGNVSRSIIAVVLTAAERTIGAITVQSEHPDEYTPDDLDAMETLAATAAIAIQNAQLFARVQELATRDELTGVFNRRHFFELALRELERAARYPHPVSLLMLDVDYFKQINDTYGHLGGDQVLQAITARCRESLRDVDVIARYGGEEFLVLLPETPRAAAALAAERLRERIRREPVLTDAGPVAVSVSIGVAGYDEHALGTVDRLLDQVDRALYEAKRSGRDQTRIFHDQGQPPS